MGASASTAHKAAGGGDIEALANELRLNKDCLNQRSAEHYTPLHFAALFGQLDCVVLLVAKGAFLDARTLERATPVFLAAKRGHLDVVRVLCENGANVNLTNRRDHTPLMTALYHKHEDVALDLVARGARLNIITKFGDRALTIAERFGMKQAAAAIVEAESHANASNGNLSAEDSKTLSASLSHSYKQQPVPPMEKGMTPASNPADEREAEDSDGSVDSTTGRGRGSSYGTPSSVSNEPVSHEEDLSLEAVTARMALGESGVKCLMCLRRPADVLLLPCRHLCVCSECNDGFSAMTRLRCPICRTSVTDHKAANVSLPA